MVDAMVVGTTADIAIGVSVAEGTELYPVRVRIHGQNPAIARPIDEVPAEYAEANRW
jgi:hypothetical protein